MTHAYIDIIKVQQYTHTHIQRIEEREEYEFAVLISRRDTINFFSDLLVSLLFDFNFSPTLRLS